MQCLRGMHFRMHQWEVIVFLTKITFKVSVSFANSSQSLAQLKIIPKEEFW